MKKKTIYALAVFVSLFSLQVSSQENAIDKRQYISYKTQFIQFKEDFNYGLVFYGINFTGEYSIERRTEYNIFAYSAEFGFGADYNKGVGLAWTFKPIHVFDGYRINRDGNLPFYLGGYIATNYFWQVYPELQSGEMFWFSSIEIGPQTILEIPVKSRLISITFSNSIAGFTSRPNPSTEGYFYSMTLFDFISNAHQNLQGGSFNLFNHTDMEIEIFHVKRKNLSIGYQFEYFGYYKEPAMGYIIHSFNLNWRIGKR